LGKYLKRRSLGIWRTGKCYFTKKPCWLQWWGM